MLKPRLSFRALDTKPYSFHTGLSTVSGAIACAISQALEPKPPKE